MPTVEQELILRGGNAELWYCLDREILVEGPRGTGKTRTILELLNAYCHKYPGIRILIVRKTERALAGSAVATLRDQVIQNGDGVVPFGGSEFEPAAFKYKNGSRIVFAGMDNSEKVKSSEYSIVYVNEATDLTEDDWTALKMLLRQAIDGKLVIEHPRIIGDCNPANSGHWLNQACEAGRITRIKTSLRDNPFLYDDEGNLTPAGESYVAENLEGLRGPRREQWLEGLWTGVADAVYPMFDRGVHVKPFPDGLYFKATIIGVDYGATHKCSVVAMSIDQFNRRWIREVWGKPDTDEGKSLNLTIAQFKERYGTKRGRGDPNQRYLNEQHGFSTARAGNGARQHRIDIAEPLFYSYPGGRVPSFSEARRLAVPVGPFAEPDSPGFFIVDGAPGGEDLARELESYHYVIKDTDRGKIKEVFRLDDDHVAGFEYANEEWEEHPVTVVLPSAISSPLSDSPRETPGGWPRRNRQNTSTEWKRRW